MAALGPIPHDFSWEFLVPFELYIDNVDLEIHVFSPT